ncbi:hypothetical protein GLS40_10845 [Pseudooceanicola sp. 216_PA32_1]|uniref:Uncharacterized protein n=1 Tax=Pseudooceanicola pacificus TaxID=2676438 RepID=A0A844W6Y9_9RHOB|nr:hypothetical protein [Pseudooceanicola pacificus]MWB78524.1 hypothetical protein [Pseudooceanicola pacificus]
MAEHHYHDTRSRSGTAPLAFIVGGLVVAVGLILFWVFGDIDGMAPATGGADIEINATSDSAAGAASDPAPAGGAADSGAAASAGAESGSGDAAAAAGADSGN